MPRSNRRRRDDLGLGRSAGRSVGAQPGRGVDGGAHGDTDAEIYGGIDLGRALGGAERREAHPDGEWFVRRVTGNGAARAYRCPGCQQEVQPGTPHIVAWPAQGMGGVEQRRHWHTTCWTARSRRPPRGSSR